jgi:hypothetical protein
MRGDAGAEQAAVYTNSCGKNRMLRIDSEGGKNGKIISCHSDKATRCCRNESLRGRGRKLRKRRGNIAMRVSQEFLELRKW